MEKPLLFLSCLAAGLLAAGTSLQADWHSPQAGYFKDDFDRPDSPLVGPGWTYERGTWSLIDGRAIPTSDWIEDKLLVFNDVELLEYPWVVSADMTGLTSLRWGGVAFHIQPFTDNYYSLIARIEDAAAPGKSAIQFRRYLWGQSTTLVSHLLPEELTLNETFRYTIISTQPGLFEFRIDRLDQETGEVVGNLITFAGSDSEFTGGRAGLHANAADDRIAFSRFVINSQELTEALADTVVHEALQVEYTPAPGRVTRLERSWDLLDWSPLGLPDTSRGNPVSEVFSIRFTDRDFFRVRSDL